MSNLKLTIKEDTKVFDDKKTHAKTIAIPFRLPDGTSSILMISRLKDEKWTPQKEIKSIVINYL